MCSSALSSSLSSVLVVKAILEKLFPFLRLVSRMAETPDRPSPMFEPFRSCLPNLTKSALGTMIVLFYFLIKSGLNLVLPGGSPFCWKLGVGISSSVKRVLASILLGFFATFAFIFRL